jgi:tRNA threonylcarbamoyladenosine biosynthesis protein TsaE
MREAELPDELVYTAADEAGTDHLGAQLVDVLPQRAVIALHGTLGAGKTRLVRAVAAASGVDPQTVVSPTFVLMQPYQGRQAIYHFDAYRLRDDDEFLQLGPEEYFDSDGLVLIEWAEKVSDCLPTERLDVQIDVIGETQRRFRIIATGDALRSSVEALRSRLAQ